MTEFEADAILTLPVAPAPTESNSTNSPGLNTVVPTPTAALTGFDPVLPNPVGYLKYNASADDWSLVSVARAPDSVPRIVAPTETVPVV